MRLIENDPVPRPPKERGLRIELLIVGDIHGRPHLGHVAGEGGISIIHELPGGVNARLGCTRLVHSASRLLQHARPSINHGEGRNEQGGHVRVVDDDRGDLDGLAEPHVVTLKATAHKGGRGTVTTRHLGAVNLLVEHPVNALELVMKVSKAMPQGANLERHCAWIG